MGHVEAGRVLLLAEISEAMNDTGIELIGATDIVEGVNGDTMLILLIVSDIALITLLLQSFPVGFDRLNGEGLEEDERQRED